MKLLFYIFFVSLFCSCKSNQTVNRIPEKELVVDSFIIDKILDGRELHTTVMLNDSIIIAWGEGYNVLSKFKRKTNVFNRVYEKVITHPNQFRCFFLDCNNVINLIDDTNEWYIFDTNKGLNRKCKLHLKLDHLKENYLLLSLHEYFAFCKDNKIFIRLTHNAVEYYYEGFNENPIVSVNLNKDSFEVARYLFPTPQYIKNMFRPFSVYCFDGKNIALLYPGIDTLYKYDINKNQYTSAYIGNKEFEQQQTVDQNGMFNSEYSTIYQLHNFQYQSIFYNKNTRHYILFYQTKVDDSIKVPVWQDQSLKAIVLNEDFKSLYYLDFKETYMYTGCFFNTSKGIAMPLYKKNYKTDGNIKYYVYNF